MDVNWQPAVLSVHVHANQIKVWLQVQHVLDSVLPRVLTLLTFL